MQQILIVEDELHISALLKTHLEREGYQCSQAFDGITALEIFYQQLPDLVLLDLMLPGKDGFEICRTIRERHDTYILMLTARQEEIDRIVGLELGADDYVTKPFSVREVLTRVKVLLRRPRTQTSLVPHEESIIFDELELKPAQMKVFLRGKLVNLTALEFDLLHFFMKNPGIVFRREQILEQVWQEHSEVYDRNIDRLISQLRRKLETNVENSKRIITIRGVGYKFEKK